MLEESIRFAFGKNWSFFLQHMNEARIQEAERSLQQALACQNLQGKTFLDVGSGSGLFSLAAHRLGARVFSFDYDQASVQCTRYLKDTYGRPNVEWSIEQGSVLDAEFLSKFEPVDVLYSWGVLHHTGQMYKAFENIIGLVKPGGFLFLSIYNDQGNTSKIWKWVKKLYVESSDIIKRLILLLSLVRLWGPTFIRDLFALNPLRTWLNYQNNHRGMSPWYDLIDWVGGYPFEVAKPEAVFDFFTTRDFSMFKLKTCGGGLGCNEFVFIKK